MAETRRGGKGREAGIEQMTAERPYVRDVLAHVARRLREIEESYQAQGRELRDLGEPAVVARRMLATLPAPSRWNDLLGPLYTTSQVAELLGGISRQAVAERRARHTLWALRTRDGVWVYPRLQFDEHNQVIEGLAVVLRVFDPEVADGWTVAAWLVSPRSELAGRSAIDWLWSGGDPRPILDLAHDAAERFAR